jgi:membrane protease YdiL (CAAX protease family)
MIFNYNFNLSYFFKTSLFFLFLFLLIFVYYLYLKNNLNSFKDLITDIQILKNNNLKNVELQEIKSKYQQKYILENNIVQKFIYYKIISNVEYILNNLNKSQVENKFNFNTSFKLAIIKANIYLKMFFVILFLLFYFLILIFLNFIFDKYLKSNNNVKHQAFFNFYIVFFVFFIFFTFVFPLINNFVLGFLSKFFKEHIVYLILVFNIFVLGYVFIVFFLFYFDYNSLVFSFHKFRFNSIFNFIKNLGFILIFFIIVFLSGLFLKEESNNLIIAFVLLSNIWELIFIFLALVFLIPLVEEIIFRFYLISYLEDIFYNKGLISVLGALIFSLVHFENLFTLFFIFVLSIYLNYVYLKYRNLYLNFLIHSIWNLLNFLVLVFI